MAIAYVYLGILDGDPTVRAVEGEWREWNTAAGELRRQFRTPLATYHSDEAHGTEHAAMAAALEYAEARQGAYERQARESCEKAEHHAAEARAIAARLAELTKGPT